MGAIHGKDTGIALAEHDLTRWCNEVSSDYSVDTADASCFDEPDGAKVYVQGMVDGTYSFAGREQGNINSPGLRQTIDDAAGTDIGAPFTVAMQRGFHPGRRAALGITLVTSITLSSPIADVVSVSGELQSDGPMYNGRVLSLKAPYAATTQGVAIDFAAPSTGAQIHYHVTQNSRNGGVTVTVQDSVDGLLWVDYDSVTLLPGATIGEGRLVEQPLDRYVRLVVSTAGTTGTATIRVALAPRK